MNAFLTLCIGAAVLCGNVIAKPQSTSTDLQDQPLISAIKSGDATLVESLIHGGANINRKAGDEDGFAALHYSAGAGLERITKILIDNGANVHIRDNDGNTPLEIAAVNGQVKIAELLIKAGAHVDSMNNDDSSILHEIIAAISNSHKNPFLNDAKVDRLSQEKVFELLLHNVANVNVRKNQSKTPLHAALVKGEHKIAKMLIENGADVNVVDIKDHGYTPMHCVIMGESNLETVRLLIEHGANINSVTMDDFGYSPLDLAVMMEFDERLIDFLIENGAQVNHALKSGLTPLHLAVSYGRVKVVESLLRAGANIHATDNDFNTPLHLVNKPKNNWVILPFSSTAEDFYAICELLINNGANVNAHNTDGKTPLDMINRKNTSVRKLLKDKMDQTS